MEKIQNKQSTKNECAVSVNQKAKQKRTKSKAKARRELTENWGRLERSTKYQRSAAKMSCGRLTQELKEELFDGILLSLRGEDKSYCCQKRTMRRIVEKRQAQSMHRIVGRTNSRYASHMLHHYVGESMNQLRRHMQCA